MKSKRYIILGLMLSLLLQLQQISYAQIYPVQLVSNVIPPYSSKLADYSNPMANRLNLQIIVTDIAMPYRQVKLQLEIEGHGIKAYTSPYLYGIRPLFISGGDMTTLSSSDLSGYFRFQNLLGIDANTYGKPLPDGVYNICYRLYDFLTGKPLSQRSCAVLYLQLNEPPMLNQPANKEKIIASDLPNIRFTWTPRSFQAADISYIYELKMLFDENLEPGFAFEVSPLLYKEENLRTTFLQYDISKPSLIPGKRYAWRVRAVSSNGISENSVFKNNGYSEVHSFTYAVNCLPVTNPLTEPDTRSSIKLHWEKDHRHTAYRIQIRKKGVENADWHFRDTKEASYILDIDKDQLEYDTDYEYRIGVNCEPPRYGVERDYLYSAIYTFQIKTPVYDDNCGKGRPAVKITSTVPLKTLAVNDIFTVGNTTVKVLEVSGSNGVFSGRGAAYQAFLIHSWIEVVFKDIHINSDYQLTAGSVKSLSDSDFYQNVNNIEDLWEVNRQQEKVNFPIEKAEDITLSSSGELVVTGPQGQTQTFPGGKDTVITDSKGKSYSVDAKGKVSGPHPQARGGKPTLNNTDGVNEKGAAVNLTAEGARVSFVQHKNSKYACDPVAYEKSISKEHTSVAGRFDPFKAVVNGEEELFTAKFHHTKSDTTAEPDSIFFKTQSGVAIPFERKGEEYTLKLKGTHSFAVEQVQATIKQFSKYQIAGVFNLVHVSPKTLKLILVPTSSKIKLKNQLDKIKAIYAPLGIDVQISIGSSLDIRGHLVDGKLPTEDESGDLSTYSPAQQAVIAHLKQDSAIEKEAYYIIVTDAASSTGQSGYMRLNGQFGFVFDAGSGDVSRTIAHELAHGAFKLEHTYTKYKRLDKGSTTSLMDEGKGTDFLYTDWRQINDPAFKFYTFQQQSEGEFAGGYVVSPDYKIFTIGTDRTKVDKNTYSANDLAANDGTLPGFTLSGKTYWWQAGKYVSTQGDYSLTDVSDNLNALKDKWLFLFFDKDKNCGNTTYIYVKIEDFIKSKKTLKAFIDGWKETKYAENDKNVAYKKIKVVCNDPNAQKWNEDNNNHLENNNNIVFVDYSNGKEGQSPFSNAQKEQLSTTVKRIDADLDTHLKVYLLNTENPDYTAQKSAAENDKSDNKLIFTYNAQSKKIDLQHQFTPPQWMADVLPAVNAGSNCESEYINEGLTTLYNNSVYKASPNFDQVLQEAAVVTYRAVFGMLYCATNEEAVQNTNAATQFVSGALHETVAAVDLVALVDGLVKIGTSAVDANTQSYLEFYRDIKLSCEQLKANQSFEPAILAKRLLPPGIRNSIKLYNTLITTAKHFSSFYFSDCDNYQFKNGQIGDICSYRYGQITVMTAPIVLTAGEWAFTKAGALSERLKTISPSGKTQEVTNILIEAENTGSTVINDGGKIIVKESDEIITIIEKNKNEVIISKVESFARYKKIRDFLSDGSIKSYLNNQELLDFEKILKTADSEVLSIIDNFKNVDEFAEMIRGYKDKSSAFSNATKNVENFSGKHGWLSFWRLTPRMENSLNIIKQLKRDGKVVNVGNATEIELASIHAYTANGDFVNVPFRYKPEWFGEYNTRAVKHINQGLDELRKVESRVYKGYVFSGKTFSKVDFEARFIGGTNKNHPYRGYMSTSKLESVAEGFIDLTKQWATGSEEKIAVIQRVTSKNGVYIDDISDWGKNLGKTNHPSANPKVQVQEEVLLNSEKLKQVSEPIPVMENGIHKIIDGMKVYYVDFIEVL